MTKLIITYDELAKKHFLITGFNRVNVETKKINFMGPFSGKSVAFEREMPINMNRKLNIGPLASLRMTINCENDIQQKINYDQFWLLSTLFTNGIDIIKEKIELIVSQMKINFAHYNYESIYLNNLIVSIYPQIINIITKKVDEELGDLAKYFQLSIISSPNLSEKVDMALDEKNRQRLDMLKTLIDVVKGSPYPLPTLTESYDVLYDIVEKKLPSKISPSDEDLKQAYQLLIKSLEGINDQTLLGGSNSLGLPEGKK